jgi:hypothetical protein
MLLFSVLAASLPLRAYASGQQQRRQGQAHGKASRVSAHQMRTLPKVATEMALHVLAYNLKRVMRILGIGELMAAMRA